MKRILFILAALLAGWQCHAQTSLAEGVAKSKLPIIYLPANVSLHFISPEPIQYVDISVKNVLGDLPLKNVLRIRLKDSVPDADAVVTIAGENFIAQYHVISAGAITGRDALTDIDIKPADTRPLDIAAIGFSQPQLKALSLSLFCSRPAKAVAKAKALGLKANLYHIYCAGNYLFLDIGYRNDTRLNYDIDEFRFKVEDKKITKATNVQSVEIKPDFILFSAPVFQKTYRNIIVLRKMTFPGDKVLHIELSEKQISGRVIILTISYKDVLQADTLPI
jgi:conjugative transposon TraN protein